MKNILSIQSHVVYGYVGNRAAVFPLQRIGMNVSALNTVQFSNHTGYGAWQGDIFSKAHIQSLFSGLKELNVAKDYHALLTGYMGSPETGEVISEMLTELRENNSNFIYCCDPVIGDVGRGIFVRPGVGEYFKKHLIKQANILTPNEFELAYLTDVTIDTISDLKKACSILIDQGVDVVVVTSVSVAEIGTDKIGVLLYSRDGAVLAITPRLSFQTPPNGAGDATAALFLGHMLKTQNPEIALAKTTEALFQIFKKTFDENSRELRLIESQNYFDTANQPNCHLEAV